MQALSCGSPSAMAASTTMPEVEKSEVAKPAADRLINMIRLSATKPDLGTPSRVPLDSNGQRLCSTPKIVRAAGGVRNLASQTPKSIRPMSGMKNLASPTPKKVQVVSGMENLAPNSQDSVGAHELPLDAFTIYANPSFEPLEIIESPSKEHKQPSCIPVDSNGQKLCPTPKRTPSLSSPGVSKLRFPKATSFQPLETIQSPTVLKDQVKGILVDSNGQRTQAGTPKLSKQFITPRERSAAFGTSCSENLTPRALFSDSHGVPAPRSISRVPHRATKLSEGVSELDGAKCTSSVAKEAVGSKMKKRARGEDDAAVEDENARVTRSKTEAEKIALFLRSPAARVRPDGRKEEYWHGISDVLVEKYSETKLMSASKIKLTQ